MPSPSPNRFSKEGEYWTISYAGKLFRLRDRKGLGYLASLVERPGVLTPVIHLAGATAAAASVCDTERARVAVSKRIKDAIRTIADNHPELALHLEATIRTGAFCSYNPSPSANFHVAIRGWRKEEARASKSPDASLATDRAICSARNHIRAVRSHANPRGRRFEP